MIYFLWTIGITAGLIVLGLAVIGALAVRALLQIDGIIR